MRALLDLIRENEAAAQNIAAMCEDVLKLAIVHLKVLDPEVGDKELIQSVAIELAKVSK